MASEPTSALTFEDLIIEVAEKIGVPYYGTAGDGASILPVNTHDLALCKKIVNNAIRMFIHDGPSPNGWRWLRPVADVDLWATVATDATNPILTAVNTAGVTTLTVGTAAFFASMELHDIVITAVGTFNIKEYVSATSVKVTGDASAAHAASKTWSITADGNYTLPIGFGGQYLSGVSFAPNTNQGAGIDWTDENVIRQWRADAESETGTPYLLAVRVMDTGSPRRRWEMLAYPLPEQDYVVQFPYMLHFDELVTPTTDVHPAPFMHDETIKAACRAVGEKEVERALGVEWDYYKNSALPASYRIDAMSAPKKLTPSRRTRNIQAFRAMYQRPNVTFNP